MTPNLPVGCAKVWSPRLQHEHNTAYTAYMYTRACPMDHTKIINYCMKSYIISNMGAIYIVGHSMTFTKTGWDVKAKHMQLCSDDNVMFMQAKYKVIMLVLARNYIPFQLTFSLFICVSCSSQQMLYFELRRSTLKRNYNFET